MDIFLVRHGEAAAHWGESNDPGLSELGARQARDVADALRGRLDARTRLISSPLARAMETAQPLADALALGVEINDAFREIPAPVPLSQRREWLRQFMRQTWEAQQADLCDWRERVMEQLLELRQPAVVFTHFLVINAAVGRLEGRSETLCFWPDNGSITHLQRRGDALELVELGAQMQTLIN